MSLVEILPTVACIYKEVAIEQHITEGLIRLKATGSARELADRLQVSKTSVYRLLDLMQCVGADIDCCHERKCYYYTTDKVLAIGFLDASQIKLAEELMSRNCWGNM